MTTKTFVFPYLQRLSLAVYYTSASPAALRIAVGCGVLVSALLMQSCATQEMAAVEKAEAPSSNTAEGEPVQQDSAADVADSATETFSFERMYRDRYKTTPDEQE